MTIWSPVLERRSLAPTFATSGRTPHRDARAAAPAMPGKPLPAPRTKTVMLQAKHQVNAARAEARPGSWRQRLRRALPPVVAALAAAALLGGALWSMDQYDDRRAAMRAAETNRFLEEFKNGRVATAWSRLQTAWEAERPRQDALLARIPSVAGSELARTLHDHHQFVLETIEEYQLERDIDVMHDYLQRLATCVRVGVCDANAAATQLGPALEGFRDQHRYYFQFEHSGVDVGRYVATILTPSDAAGDR